MFTPCTYVCSVTLVMSDFIYVCKFPFTNKWQWVVMIYALNKKYLLLYTYHYKIKSKRLIMITQGKTQKYSMHTCIQDSEDSCELEYQVFRENDEGMRTDLPSWSWMWFTWKAGWISTFPSLTKLNAWSIWENEIIITVVTRAALVLSRGTAVLIIAYISGLGFPGGSVGKKSTFNAGVLGNLGLIAGMERSPRGRHGNPLQYPCLENPHGQRSLVDYSP